MSESPKSEWIASEVASVFKTLSGRNFSPSDFQATFFELGFDSLLLTQASQTLRQKFGIKITFRQLMESLFTLEAVSAYVEKNADRAKAFPPPAPDLSKVSASAVAKEEAVGPTVNFAGGDAVDRLVRDQLDIMHQQLDLLRGMGKPLNEGAHLNGHTTAKRTAPVKSTPATPTSENAPRFGPYKPLDRSPGGGLTPRQQDHLNRLVAATVARTPRSKAHTQRHRAHFADPRTIAGFRPQWKELVYPIVVKHSEGSRFRDLDNNEYLDFTMGFGTNLFGHSPRFLTRGLAHQLKHGVEVGPQSAVAGKVAQLLCEMTGAERAAFCSTGSEAVLAAIRLARTVSGRTKIATMGGYHGINDEVLVRAAVVDGVRRPVPVAPGVPQHSVDEVLVLDYGTTESLELLRAHAHELAAVLVEPVKSRQPELQPVEFLREVRKITAESETALIFDEIITGFRAHPGGAQALWGIQADLATYGKIIGGGMPIGALCGKAKYMDALDGGDWSYGDDSAPEVGMTFFAGTYVRHPLAVRAALSVLRRLKREGPALQEQLSARAARLAQSLNEHFEREKIPMGVTLFRSMLYFVFHQEFKYSALLFAHLRLKGIHIWEGRPIFISTTHTDEEIDFVIEAFKQSLTELREGDFLPAPAEEEEKSAAAPFAISPSPRATNFSLYFFGNYDAAFREDKYQLLLDAAKFGDTHGFTAVWLPERHFHSVGGFSPNSSLLACALAPVTSRLKLRGGSVVLPLHHPVRVAEEWSVADNLSQGRTAISIATGWHPNDFVFAPEAFPDRRDISMKNLQMIQKLWRGESVDLPTPGGTSVPVKLHPLPKQAELPVWLTCIHQESYLEAGRSGFNVLGYLMNQTVAELGEKIAAYREGRRSAGLDPAQGHVTTLLFTYLEEDAESARRTARAPLCDYLRAYLDNSEKKIKQQLGDVSVDEDDVAYLTNRSCNDYFDGKSLIGSPDSCRAVVSRLREIGVDEIGCFIDFGVGSEQVLKSLELAAKLITPDDAVPSSETASTDSNVIVSLPPAEQGLWLLSSMDGDAARAYRESVTLKLEGNLNRAALERALREVVARHGALRTTIALDGQSQTVTAQVKADLLFLDFSLFAPEDAHVKAIAKLAEMERASFDLSRPFLESHLLRLEENRHLLVLFFHHLVGNGPSYWVVLEELAQLYSEYAGGPPAKLPAPVPFREFVASRQSYAGSPKDAAAAESFWIDQLQGGVPILDLPFDHALPPVLTYRGDRQETILDSSLTARLRQLGASHRSSLFMVLLAAYGAMLHRLSGQDDVVIGAPFDSPFRAENADRNLFANTTNMLPLRSRIAEGQTFLSYLEKMKGLVLAASEHQDYFFGSLLGKLKVPHNPARSPLFNVIFNLETGAFRREAPGLTMELETRDVPYRGPRDSAMFDLYLNVAEREGGDLLVQCDHNTALVSGSTMSGWLDHFRALLLSIVENPEAFIADLSLSRKTSGAAPALKPQPATAN